MSRTVVQRTRPRRREFFRSPHTGELTTDKRYDEKRTYQYDLTNDLDTSETISTAVWEMSGPTKNADSVSGAVLSITITGAGSAVCTVTTSAGRILEYKFRWVGIDYETEDYQ